MTIELDSNCGPLVHGTIESVEWLWNKHFAAVAGDAWAFEALPPLKEDGTVSTNLELGTFRGPRIIWSQKRGN